MQNASLPECEEWTLHNREVSHARNKDRHPSESQKWSTAFSSWGASRYEDENPVENERLVAQNRLWCGESLQKLPRMPSSGRILSTWTNAARRTTIRTMARCSHRCLRSISFWRKPTCSSGIYYSHFFEVVVMRTTTSQKMIEALTPIFTRYGYPFSLKSDNAPQFVSEEFEAFLTDHGINWTSKIPTPLAPSKWGSRAPEPNIVEVTQNSWSRRKKVERRIEQIPVSIQNNPPQQYRSNPSISNVWKRT